MKKGSIVKLKITDPVVQMCLMYTLRGMSFPEFNVEYILSTDLIPYKCSRCEMTHHKVTLEEIPNTYYDSEIFVHLQDPEEVQINALLEGVKPKGNE